MKDGQKARERERQRERERKKECLYISYKGVSKVWTLKKTFISSFPNYKVSLRFDY